MKHIAVVAALIAWFAIALWLWIMEISLEAELLWSLPLEAAGFGGFFGYLSYHACENDPES